MELPKGSSPFETCAGQNQLAPCLGPSICRCANWTHTPAHYILNGQDLVWPESVAGWSTAPGDPGPVWSPFIPCAMVGSHLFSGSLQNRISNFGFPGVGGAQRAGAITEGNRGYCGSKAPPVNHLEELHGLWGRMAPPKPTLLIVSWERELGPHGGTWEGLVICRARGSTSSGDQGSASPLRWPPTNSSLLSRSPLLVPELISLLALELSWCLPHAGHCSGTVEEGGSHLARGAVQKGGDFQCSGILALRDQTEGAWTVRMGKGTLWQAPDRKNGF